MLRLPPLQLPIHRHFAPSPTLQVGKLLHNYIFRGAAIVGGFEHVARVADVIFMRGQVRVARQVREEYPVTGAFKLQPSTESVFENSKHVLCILDASSLPHRPHY